MMSDEIVFFIVCICIYVYRYKGIFLPEIKIAFTTKAVTLSKRKTIKDR